jgi:hypothetical protein
MLDHAKKEVPQFLLFARYYWHKPIKDSEMDGACSLHGANEHFGWKLKGRDYSKDIGIDWRIIL